MEKIEQLNNAFTVFEEASRLLEEKYRELEGEIRNLRLEVEEKNAALEESLAETEKGRLFLDKILEGIPTGVIVFNPEGAVLRANTAARDLVGSGTPVNNVLDLPFDIVATEALIPTKEGKPLHFLVKYSGVGDVGSVLILQDITRMKDLEREAEFNRRLAAMGELVAKIAHEIRNPLGSIELFASMLSEELAGSPLKDQADGISTGVRSLVNTLNNMLMYTRTRRISRVPLDLGRVLGEALDFIGVMARRTGVDVESHAAAEQPARIRGDAELIKQILYNLAINAVQAMPDGGRLGLTLDTSHADYIRLTIRDTGVGIEPENLERIFDPFFSTKDRGNGLGLSIVKTVMKEHDGHVSVSSVPGKGTEFVLVFPKAELSEVPRA